MTKIEKTVYVVSDKVVKDLQTYMCEFAKEEGIPEHEIAYLDCLELPDDDITMENNLGRVNMHGKAKTLLVEIWPREGWEKPHLHAYNKNFKTAIRLDVAEYFNHGPYNKQFNDNQAKIFDDFMREKINDAGDTRWKVAVDFFNNIYPNHKIDIDSQPDYSKLNEKKGK